MKKEKNTTIHHVLKYIGLFGSVEMLKILANLSKRLTSRYPRELPAVVEILSSLLPNNVATSHMSPWHTGNWYI